MFSTNESGEKMKSDINYSKVNGRRVDLDNAKYRATTYGRVYKEFDAYDEDDQELVLYGLKKESSQPVFQNKHPKQKEDEDFLQKVFSTMDSQNESSKMTRAPSQSQLDKIVGKLPRHNTQENFRIEADSERKLILPTQFQNITLKHQSIIQKSARQSERKRKSESTPAGIKKAAKSKSMMKPKAKDSKHQANGELLKGAKIVIS